MTNEVYIKKLYNKQDELFKIINYHNIFGADAQDLLQEFYIKMYNSEKLHKYTLNDEPNMYIMFAILRNMCYDKHKKNVKLRTEELTNMDIECPDYEDNEKWNFIENEIEKIKYWFDKTIIKLYIFDNHSLRSLSKETQIGVHFLHPIIFNFKERCKENYKKNNKIKMKNILEGTVSQVETTSDDKDTIEQTISGYYYLVGNHNYYISLYTIFNIKSTGIIEYGYEYKKTDQSNWVEFENSTKNILSNNSGFGKSQLWTLSRNGEYNFRSYIIYDGEKNYSNIITPKTNI